MLDAALCGTASVERVHFRRRIVRDRLGEACALWSRIARHRLGEACALWSRIARHRLGEA